MLPLNGLKNLPLAQQLARRAEIIRNMEAGVQEARKNITPPNFHQVQAQAVKRAYRDQVVHPVLAAKTIFQILARAAID